MSCLGAECAFYLIGQPGLQSQSKH
uniref:Uncharacterized protein n=1 Tax=Anguilla anguilla TaxID=7936 RepID=A0A0E9TYU4_ANGAN